MAFCGTLADNIGDSSAGHDSDLFEALDLGVSNELEAFCIQILRVTTWVLEALTAKLDGMTIRIPVTVFVPDKIIVSSGH